MYSPTPWWPEDKQPPGAINFSRIDNAKLNFQFTEPIVVYFGGLPITINPSHWTEEKKLPPLHSTSGLPNLFYIHKADDFQLPGPTDYAGVMITIHNQSPTVVRILNIDTDSPSNRFLVDGCSLAATSNGKVWSLGPRKIFAFDPNGS
jgi:hypothetical protein